MLASHMTLNQSRYEQERQRSNFSCGAASRRLSRLQSLVVAVSGSQSGGGSRVHITGWLCSALITALCSFAFQHHSCQACPTIPSIWPSDLTLRSDIEAVITCETTSTGSAELTLILACAERHNCSMVKTTDPYMPVRMRSVSLALSITADYHDADIICTAAEDGCRSVWSSRVIYVPYIALRPGMNGSLVEIKVGATVDCRHYIESWPSASFVWQHNAIRIGQHPVQTATRRFLKDTQTTILVCTAENEILKRSLSVSFLVKPPALNLRSTFLPTLRQTNTTPATVRTAATTPLSQASKASKLSAVYQSVLPSLTAAAWLGKLLTLLSELFRHAGLASCARWRMSGAYLWI